MQTKNLWLILLCFCCNACVKDRPDHASKEFKVPPISWATIIVNEGNLGLGNASLSILDQQDWTMYNDVFEQVNNQPMGDIFQSIHQLGDQLYLLMNNSDEILVVDAETYVLKDKIAIKKPRNMLQVGEHIAYVTSLFNQQVYVLDTEHLNIIDSISLPFEHSEQLTLLNGYVYICNWHPQSSYIYKIDPLQHQIISSIDLGVQAAHDIIVDQNEHLWIFSGQPHYQIPSAITIYDPANETILKQKIFDGVAEYMKPALSPNADTIYYLGVDYEGRLEGNGVFYSTITDPELTRHTFLSAAPYQYFWGLGIDRSKGHLYLADPRGFIQKGRLSIYDLKGQLLFEDYTGIGPGNIYFIHP